MKLFLTRMRPSTLLMLACFGVGASAAPTLAAPTPTDPSVIALSTNVLQNDGSYLWSYQVTSGSKPSLSHWVLGIDSSLLPGLSSIIKTASEDYEIVKLDPTTGLSGIKFDTGYDDGEQRIVSFKLTQSYTPTIQTLAFKSGTSTVTTQTIKFATTAVPEPSTLGLLAIAPLAIGVVRRRRAK